MLNVSGMVDLIVCYDASASPTRLVQRMGRAARKRDGSIVVLLTEGKEENVCLLFLLSFDMFLPEGLHPPVGYYSHTGDFSF